mgnify:CR=1 FL=1
MFNKLLSNLPFNPSLIGQVSFYSKRLHQETSVRRLGFILVILTMALQLFAVLAPAQPSLARDGNDVVPGGFQSKDQAVQLCRSNASDFGTILKHFGITCDNLAGGQVQTIRSTDANDQLFSMGHQAQGPKNLKTGRLTDEVPVVIKDLPIEHSTYYMRRLSSWDSGAYSTYKALSVGNIFGVHYYILFSCGNPVQTGKPTSPPPPATPVPPKPALPKPTPIPTPAKPTPPETPDVCPLIPGKQTKKSECLPCDKAQNDTDVGSCLVLGKKAKNTTQGIANANDTTANPGDTIIYTLSVKNTGSVDAKFIVQENMSDVAEYADITSTHGATKSVDNVLTWSAQTVAAGNTITKQITVKVKDPVPQTPAPCANATVTPCPHTQSFDLIMTNVYSNTVSIRVKPPLAKTVETVTNTTLPNTGPGTSLAIGFAGVVTVGYFFARSRLLAKELDIVRSEYTTSGGL